MAAETPRGPRPSRFFGRDRELAELAAVFVAGARLVTIFGPSGIGKTRIALRFLEDRRARNEPSLFCDLSEAKDATEVGVVLARALSVALVGDVDVTRAILDALAARGSLLVVLDNCEDLVEPIASLAAAMLARAPDLRLLSTSRTLLSLAGESAYELGPLDTEGAAIDLFVDRARAANATLAPAALDRAVVGHLVRRLDGLPLAIELAAARVRVLTPAAIVARLDRPLDVLAAGPRDVADRHRTLRAAIAGSWEQLSPAEADALAQMSVFRGGFDLAAAAAVVDVSRHGGAPPVLDVVQSACERSLLRAHVGGPSRFGFYLAIRAFAAERLAAAGGEIVQATRRRHAEHFATAGAEWSDAWVSEGEASALERLATESENLTDAHAFALAAADADLAFRLVNSLASLYIARGPTDAYADALARSLSPEIASRASPALLAKTLVRRGYLHCVLGLWDLAREDLSAALVASTRAGQRDLDSNVLRLLATNERLAGNMQAARRWIAEAVAAARDAGNASILSLTLLNLAQIEHVTGGLGAARRALEEIEALEAAGGAHASFGLRQHTLACVLQESGELARARAEHLAAVELARRLDHRHYLGWFVLGLAQLEHEAGSLEAARVEYEEARSIVRSLGDRAALAIASGALGALHAASGRVDEALLAFAEADEMASALGHTRLRIALSVHRGHLELAELRRTRDPERRRAFAEGARARLFAARDPSISSDDVRFAQRLLGRALAAEGLADTDEPRDALSVAEDATWFAVGAGRRVDLRARPGLRSLLAYLVRRRIDDPGVGLTMDEIVRGGWPEERVSRSAGKNRVHVSLSRLRKLGLDAVLRTEGQKHFLDPKIAVRIAAGADAEAPITPGPPAPIARP